MGHTMSQQIPPAEHMAFTSSQFSIGFEWMWQSNTDPFSDSKPAKWHYYSDVENIIIEEAFTTKKTHVVLDDYYIDFERQLQVSNENINNQMPIKRLMCRKDDKHLREERYMPDPISPKRPFGGQYGWISPFILLVRNDLKLKHRQTPSKDETIVSMIVEKAALGIIEEGRMVRKRCEAERMAKYLMEKREAGMKEIWKCCAHLYTMDSFLYRKLNEVMRLIGSEEHEHVWRSKVRTFGPFCLLLWDDPFNIIPTIIGHTLYRGANLPDDLIQCYIDDCSQRQKPQRSFQAFTSCSRNRAVAEIFSGNVLFIIWISYAFNANLSTFSKFPEEEEELIFPGVSLTVMRVEYDNAKKQYLIYLSLSHKQNDEEISELSRSSSQPFEQMSTFRRIMRFFPFIGLRDFLLRNLFDAFRDRVGLDLVDLRIRDRYGA